MHNEKSVPIRQGSIVVAFVADGVGDHRTTRTGLTVAGAAQLDTSFHVMAL